MIRELFTLAKLLFHRTGKNRDLVFLQMEHFPFKGYRYMMWCGYLITRDSSATILPAALRHERIHLMQAQRYSHWWKFYLRYRWEWLKGNPFTSPSKSAYYTIPFEMEAYANQQREGYMPTADSLKRYDIKERKKTFKAYTLEWFNYIRTL